MNRWLIVVICSVLTVACSGLNVKQDYDTSVNFHTLKTYAWQPQTRKEADNVLANNSLLDSRVRNAVDRELTGKGYRKVATDKADYLVNYHYTITDKTESDRVRTSVGVGTGSRGTFGGFGVSFGSRDRDYEQSTLVIDTVNPENGKLLWRGFARQRLVWQSDPERTTAKINTTVDAILKKFPPK